MRNFFKSLRKTDSEPATESVKTPKSQPLDQDVDGTVMSSFARPNLSVPVQEDIPTAPTTSIPLPSSLSSQAKLVDQRETGGLGAFSLTNAVTIVSRKNEWGMANAKLLLIENAGISRNHATIELQDSKFWLRDLGSTNGTYLNGTLIKEKVPLHHGDLVRFHTFNFLFVLSDAK